MRKKILLNALVLLFCTMLQSQITIETVSQSDLWSPVLVTKGGSDLIWSASNADIGILAPVSQIGSDPVFDFSGNINGLPIDIVVTSPVDGFSGLTQLDLWNDNLTGSEITDIDVSDATSLALLNLRYNLLTSIDVTSNPSLTYLNIRGNSQLSSGSIDLSNNILLSYLQADVTQLSTINLSSSPLLTDVRLFNAALTSPELDQIVIDLDVHGLSNGNLQISSNPGGLSAASLDAYNSLIGRGWTIDLAAPIIPVPITEVITLTTTSASGAWSPLLVVNAGATLTWEASGADIPTQTFTENDPT